MAMNLLSDKQIKALKTEAKAKTYTDGDGLALEVTLTGSKRWRFRFRFDGKAKLVSLGLYPAVSLADARTKRNEARITLAGGVNPFEKKPKVIQEVIHKTFIEWSEYYLDKVKDDVSESHITRTLKGYKADVYPYIGNEPMNDIKPKNIINILHIMAERDAKESAKKVFSSISRCFDVCIANYPDEVEINPCKSVSIKDVLGKTIKKHYPIITEEKKLGTLLNLIDEYTGYKPLSLALQLISHTFVRPSNIRFSEWTEFNSKTRQWIIPASKMKTKKELIVPLSKQVMKIISEAKEHSRGSKYLFPSPRSINTSLSDAAMVSALRRLGYASNEIVAHSFRGIFSTIAHEKAIYSHDVIETQLAHSVGSSVSQAYNRAEHLKERTEMMQWYSNLMEQYQVGAK